MFGSFLPSLLVGFSTTNFTRAGEPTLSWNQLHSSALRKAMMSAMGIYRQTDPDAEKGPPFKMSGVLFAKGDSNESLCHHDRHRLCCPCCDTCFACRRRRATTAERASVHSHHTCSRSSIRVGDELAPSVVSTIKAAHAGSTSAIAILRQLRQLPARSPLR